MFPPIARASLFDRCLYPLWEEKGEDLPTDSDYHELLKNIVCTYTEKHPDLCKTYMEGVNADLLDQALPSLVGEQGEYQPELLTIFYTRVRHRILGKIKKRKINPADYFNLSKTKLVPEGERGMDIQHAVTEELAEVSKVHEALSWQNKLKKLSDAEINAYKYDNTWFKNVNNDIFLEIVEVLVDATDKGNSLGNKITHMISNNAATPKPSDNTPHVFMPSPFQIIGLVIGAFYLGISIITPLYQKYKLKRDQPVINRWSMRYFIPSAILFPLGIAAFAAPVAGIAIGMVFAAYSLLSNIFKVYMYFYYYTKLNTEIAQNRKAIDDQANKRKKLHLKIETLKAQYKKLSSELADPNELKACADSIVQHEQDYLIATDAWLSALSDKEELGVKKIRTMDKITGVLNILRLAVVCTAFAAAVMSFFPPMLPIAGIMLLTTLCVGTALLTIHYVNKFYLIKEEKSQAKMKNKQFEPKLKRGSSFEILERMDAEKTKIKSPKPAHKAEQAGSNEARKPTVTIKGGLVKFSVHRPHHGEGEPPTYGRNPVAGF